MQEARLTSGGGTSYLQAIRRFPMLDAEEEHMLAAHWRERGDGSVAHPLVTSDLRLAAKIAMAYRRCGLPIADLISEGNIGLMQAVNRFDPNRGFRFSTYAAWWIKAAIQNYILRSWSLVKLGTTANQKKLFFNLPKVKRRLSARPDGDLRHDQVTIIADGLGVTEQEVIEMNRRLSGDVSLNTPLNDNGDSIEWQDRLADEGSDQESIIAESDELETRKKALEAALTVLDGRERQIFEARRLIDPPRPLDELANKFTISRERIRQIESRSFQKVRRATHAACTRRQHSLMARQLKA